MDSIHKDIWINAPIETVWDFITDQRKIAQWLMPNDFAPVQGHCFNMQCEPMDGSNGIVECVVEECQPPSRLVYSWTIDKPPITTLVEIQLNTENNGTRLKLVHSGWEQLSEQDSHVRDRHDQGWTFLLGQQLKSLTENQN